MVLFLLANGSSFVVLHTVPGDIKKPCPASCHMNRNKKATSALTVDLILQTIFMSLVVRFLKSLTLILID